MNPRHVPRHTRNACRSALVFALTHPMFVGVLALSSWLLHLVPLWMGVAALLALFFVSVSGPDRTEVLSSLVSAEKFLYRKIRLHIKWRRTMLRAKLKDVNYIEDTVGSFKPVPGRPDVPKLKLYDPRYAPRMTPCGMVVTVDGSRIAVGVDKFEREVLALKAAYKLRDVVIREHPSQPAFTQLGLISDDPFARVIYPLQLPRSDKPGHVVVGLDSDGEPVEKNLILPQLIVGSMGAGKSNEVWCLLYMCIAQGIPIRIRLLDPKGGMEFYSLAGRVYYYESDPTNLDKFLQRALRGLEGRQVAMKNINCVNWLDLAGNPEFPLDIMIIDELITGLALMKSLKVKFHGEEIKATDAFLVYLTQGRAAGFTTWALSQLGNKEGMPNGLRDLFPYTTCLRVTSSEQVRMVLGDPKLYPAHRIPIGDASAGIGYSNLDGRPIKYRAAKIDKAAREFVGDGLEGWTNRYRKSDPLPAVEKVVELEEVAV